MTLAYLSLGSNLGDRLGHLREGVRIAADSDEFRTSSVYETEPVGGVAQTAFYNLVLELRTDASAHDLLQRARRAESARERVRRERWGPRTLDVDVLLVGSESCDEPALTVPHPRMWERRFVVAPLAELRPDLVSAEVLAAAHGSVQQIGTLETLR